MIYIFILAVAILLILFLHRENTVLSVNRFTVTSEKLENDVYAAHVSDFHNTHNTVLQESIISSLKENKPDCIFVTGDLIDSRRTDIDCAVTFAEKLTEIAPVYYVVGNHEIRSKQYKKIMEAFEKTDMMIMHNINKVTEGINLIGLDDLYTVPYNERSSLFTERYQKLKDSSRFNLVLFHRPELFDTYCDNEIDLILCGHAHGGQFRLPVIGAVLSPNQGLFPIYTENLYTREKTQMIVSRGIGNSLFPFRLNNKPELIYIKLEKKL